MKKFTLLATIFIILVTLSGCMKMNLKMTIHNDKSMDVEIIEAVPKEITEEGKVEEELEWIKKNAKPGTNYELYEDDRYKGFKADFKVDSIDTLIKEDADETTMSEVANQDGTMAKIFTVEKVSDGEIYTAVFENDATDDYGDTSELSEDARKVLETLDMKMTVVLPVKPISHNATTVSEDGKTLTWDLTKVTDDVTFSFKLQKKTDWIIPVAIISTCVIAVVLYAIIKAGRTDEVIMPNTEEENLPEEEKQENKE